MSATPARRRPLVLDDEQQMLRDAANELVAETSPVGVLRARRAAAGQIGFDPALWARLAELGWVGITLPPAHGGSGGRLSDVAVVLEALGRTLTPVPLLSTELLAGGVLAAAGSPEQQAAHLPAVCAGERLLALALEDHHHHDRTSPRTTATRTDDGFELAGLKQGVIDGHVADHLVVIARLGDTDGCTAFLVDPRTPGITIRRNHLIDHRITADITFDRVTVPRDAVVGDVGRIGPVLDDVLDRATAALCAEMLGGAQAIFDLTVGYMKDRIQFGQPIGSFQALQHRAATWHCDLELARSIVIDALHATDDGRADAPAVVSAAKATINDVFLHSGAEGIQLHGGIGMTYEADPGLYVARARVASAQLGDTTHHRRRFAAHHGY